MCGERGSLRQWGEDIYHLRQWRGVGGCGMRGGGRGVVAVEWGHAEGLGGTPKRAAAGF